MAIYVRADRALTLEQQRALAEAIAEAERRTPVEVVAAVATESGRYDRAESIVGLIGSMVLLTAVHTAYATWHQNSGAWSAVGPSSVVQLASVAVGFLMGTALASYLHPIRRLFVTRREQATEVRRSAVLTYGLCSLDNVTHGSYVLIYVSLFEHAVHVVADGNTASQLGEAGLDAIRDAVVARLQEGDLFGALREGITCAADRLAEVSDPPTGPRTQGLPNHVRLIHPRP